MAGGREQPIDDSPQLVIARQLVTEIALLREAITRHERATLLHAQAMVATSHQQGGGKSVDLATQIGALLRQLR